MTTGDEVFRIYDDLSSTLAPITREIREQVNTVTAVYDPLQYAALPWKEYLERFCTGRRRVLFLGMNPGPWGMAQTGIPFGEVDSVRSWMGIETHVGTPEILHPARPIEGFNCTRSEVSGRRFWTLMRERFGSAELFFRDHLVLNFCPLVFMSESGSNITPDKLPAAYRNTVDSACEAALADAVRILDPRHLVGIGRFAGERLARIRKRLSLDNTNQSKRRRDLSEPVRILHPSPASPAANRGWAEAATEQLVKAGVW